MTNIYSQLRNILEMRSLLVLVVVSLQAVRGQERPGFSVACQSVKTIGQMTRQAEIVTEARVVDVSPARDNVYAVTLQVCTYFFSAGFTVLIIFSSGFTNLQRKT